MDDEAVLLAWLRQLAEVGLTLVRGVPYREGEVTRLAERIGCVRASNFGRVFDVRSIPAPNALAYTSGALLPHTDLLARELQPGLQFLHCLVFDAAGGDSRLVDGFRAAELLRQSDPGAFERLAGTPVTFRHQEADADLWARAPMIRVGPTGAVAEVRFSNAKLQPFEVPEDQVRPLYEAYFAFARQLRDPALAVTLRLRPGDLLAFDNRRVLHAARLSIPRAAGATCKAATWTATSS